MKKVCFTSLMVLYVFGSVGQIITQKLVKAYQQFQNDEQLKACY